MTTCSQKLYCKGKHQELPDVVWDQHQGTQGEGFEALRSQPSASPGGEKARTAESQEFRRSAFFASYWSTPILLCTSLFLHYSNEKKKN